MPMVILSGAVGVAVNGDPGIQPVDFLIEIMVSLEGKDDSKLQTQGGFHDGKEQTIILQENR